MTGAVKALCRTKGAKPLDCGQSLRWVQISSGKVKSKAFKFGSPQKNILSLKPGHNPEAPKELEYDRAHQSPCLAAEYMAQMKGALPPRQGEDKAEPAERKALADLKSDDTLYIVGHGNPLGATLTFKCSPPASHPVRDKGKDEDQPGACNNSEHADLSLFGELYKLSRNELEITGESFTLSVESPPEAAALGRQFERNQRIGTCSCSR